ncbi:hypothetical protein OLMES_0248 [Oleiphilus messinensis]|uniref:DUF3450 domain-containing protein n=1 Tax=Oleiphilus messinensis TaxID=141451 RepID=A0A1Y0I4H1_9GAMM|nr:DUF3450 family protein [Oleiphilus messinensis]ARU54354.1 hypothetical protein OLMES_0248 [Oleiphilus messinensis]
MKAKYLGSVLLSAGVLSGSAFGADADLASLENISQELVEIRQDIAKLHDDIRFEKSRFNDQLRSYSNQKSDLEVKINRSELNLKELQRELGILKEKNAEKFEAFDNVTPVLEDAIAQLRTIVEGSLPFKLSERLQALDDIKHRLQTNLISPNKAANQLWAYIEDELILGRSSGIYNESLEVNGEAKLVKVLRIGKVAMFYKSQDDGYGVLKQQQGNWVKQAVTDKQQVIDLDGLFDAFNKNIHNGLFTVPNFIPQS